MNSITGEQLYNELRAAAAKSGKSLTKFVAPLYSDNTKLEQLRMAKTPKQTTVDRVRALLAGQSLPEIRPSPRKGVPTAGDRLKGANGEYRITGEEIASRRALTDLARTDRLPGETLQDAIKRLTARGGLAHG